MTGTFFVTYLNSFWYPIIRLASLKRPQYLVKTALNCVNKVSKKKAFCSFLLQDLQAGKN